MEKLAELLSVLYIEGGFIGGSLFFLAISTLISYALIKKRYCNVFICETLKNVYDELIEKGEGSKISEVLVANGYSVLVHVFIDLAKVVFSLIYILTLKTEALSFVDCSVIDFPLFDMGWNIMKAGDARSFIIVGIIVILTIIDTIISASISKKCFVESGNMDMIISIVICASVLLLPAGYGLFLLALSIVELAVTLMNLGPLKNLNMNKTKRAMDKYNAAYRAKVLKENKPEKKAPEKSHRQPSELHPSKKRKK